MLLLSSITIYPIKGFPGIQLEEAVLEPQGLQYDRRWMLVDEQGVFISQRTSAQLALFGLNQKEDGFEVIAPNKSASFFVPFATNGIQIPVKVWDDEVLATHYSNDADAWFSKQLNLSCSLVFLPAQSTRLLESNYNPSGLETVSFADGFPYLLIGHESLNDLNQRLAQPILMDRFRPNFVITGGIPFLEDSFTEFSIGSNQFAALKPCARCTVTTINQQSAIQEKEPLKTLSTYRQVDNKILFGMNVVWRGGSGLVRIAESVKA
ncbi:MAG: MOSC domain-containing protein [Bacteroidetes bacterium B1(2017)]|nr:MAG: MOSC domain-containing protein [Bacteroidetes bacterium B1(2017)]